MADAAFQIEKTLFSGKCPPDRGEHLFVCGLARAGTTLLMRLLHGTGEFCSLTYRDMPFVLAPNFWARLNSASRRTGGMRERAHGDGLLVDFDSPEALEEVFWRSQCGSDYIRPNCLVPMNADDDVLADFRTYIQLVLLRYGSQRYLAKNNNNILRLGSLSRAFPRALVVIPFRHPVAQAVSLWQQHRHFCAEQAADPFARQYMDWLVHHEFGHGHRPFCWHGKALKAEPADINYWLRLWCASYRHLAADVQAMPERRLLLCYETLCSNPQPSWQQLAAKAGLTPTLPDVLAINAPQAVVVPEQINSELLAEAENLYRRLQAMATNSPG